jgi:hypothetical protein
MPNPRLTSSELKETCESAHADQPVQFRLGGVELNACECYVDNNGVLCFSLEEPRG